MSETNKKYIENDDLDYKYEELKETQGSKKLKAYFRDLVKTKEFIEIIKDIRSKYGIPENGYENRNMPPDQILKKRKEITKDIVEKICNKFYLPYYTFFDTIEYYIYSNEIINIFEAKSCELCKIIDEVDLREWPSDFSPPESDDISYPISIRISPYASQNDIVDYIRNEANFKIIKYLQNKHADRNTKLGKSREKDFQRQKMYDFIYENRNLPRKKICSLVYKKFPFEINDKIDEGSVGKIISDEIKKRNKC